LPALRGQVAGMDAAAFKSWRKDLRYTQDEAATELGVTRSTIHNWEHEATALPGAIDLACEELTRSWKQRLTFGPVLLVYTVDPIQPVVHDADHLPILHCEPLVDNEAAIRRVIQLRGASNVAGAWILAEGERIIWNNQELLLECETRGRTSNYGTSEHRNLSFSIVKTGDKSMDSWALKKWRKQFNFNQFDAAAQLGVRRASIQNWEREIWPIPQVIFLACQSLTRRRDQRPSFGPVMLIFVDGEIWQTSEQPYHVAILQKELYADNEAAFATVNRLRKDPCFASAFILQQSGEIIWTPSELLRELDKRRRGVTAKS
jgi:DNA-binding XRE family transcriptional regulator